MHRLRLNFQFPRGAKVDELSGVLLLSVAEANSELDLHVACVLVLRLEVGFSHSSVTDTERVNATVKAGETERLLIGVILSNGWCFSTIL